MTRNNRIALYLLAASAACAPAATLRAQVTSSPAINARPVHTAVVKPVWTRFEVLNMTGAAIQVRSLVNQREIHTFTYSNEIRAQMQKRFNRGGYRYGDKIKLRYQPGTSVALHVKGKPSKPR